MFIYLLQNNYNVGNKRKEVPAKLFFNVSQHLLITCSLTQFELKFRHIPERLYTQEAREIAKERMQFMQNFFEKLKREIKGGC